MEALPTEIAWAAGIFEGEGTIGWKASRSYPQLVLVSTDEDIVDRFGAVLGVGTKHAKTKHSGFAKKQQYIWSVAAINEIRHVAVLFSPWLGERRRARLFDVLDAYNTAEVARLHARPCGRFT